MNDTASMRASAIYMATGMALGLLMVALLGAGGGIGAHAVTNGGMGGGMSGNQIAQCGAMNAACSQDPATCAQNMRDGTDPGCQSMNMTLEQCQTMHDSTSGGMMSGGMASGSCH